MQKRLLLHTLLLEGFNPVWRAYELSTCVCKPLFLLSLFFPSYSQGLVCCCSICKERGEQANEMPQCWEALQCALAYLLILQVLTVHKGHVEPDSVRQLDFLLPSRLLRNARTELLRAACVPLVQSVTRHLCLAPLRIGASVSIEVYEMAPFAAVAGCH